MKLEELFPSKWLKASDLQGQKVRVIIDSVTKEDFDDETKPVIFFAGKEKGMVLNRTNAGILAASLGDETDRWIGHQITLYSMKVPFRGKMVDSIRVSVPEQPQPVTKPAPPVQPQPQPSEPAGEGDDSDLKF